MRVVIVHNEVSDDSSPDERDVMVQAESVFNALETLHHEAVLLPCTLNLSDMKKQLEKTAPDLVFNLVESLDGYGRLIHLFPALLDAMNIPYSGSSSGAVFMTSHKLMAKERMAAMNLPTPEWISAYADDAVVGSANTVVSAENKQWIIKSVWEHASVGLDEDCLISSSSIEDIKDIFKKNSHRFGGQCFAEAYVEGREFNLSLLAGKDGHPEVLPPAEILFEGYEPGKPRIVGYRAKWDETSYEYHHTPRRFDFPSHDEPLLNMLRNLAIRCWECFRLSGYARVDFRVDTNGCPQILEINANPCLSPDAGYMAAAGQAGLSFADVVEKVLLAIG